MHWFGEPWPSVELRAPICEDDGDRIPVPVGEPCLWCSEPITEDDRGVDMPYVTGESATIIYVHRECQFRQVMGGPAHLNGSCICCGGTDDPDMGMSPRDAALHVWRHFSCNP